jgi:hypothetical protein
MPAGHQTQVTAIGDLNVQFTTKKKKTIISIAIFGKKKKAKKSYCGLPGYTLYLPPFSVHV